jgi:tripartite-type tricarboxylate transporter receptor subunit TctC
MPRTITKYVAALATILLCRPVIAAPEYPAHPISLIVPFVAGASSDALARIVGKALTQKLNQTVVVENRAGAGGIIAADYVRRQKPDGYTFMLTTDGILSVVPSIMKSVPYDPLKDFSPLTIGAVAPVVLIVRADSPFKSMQDIVDYAKAHPPGTLTFGSSGIGTSQHIAGELFNELAGVTIKHVPYKGGAPAMTDLLGGQVSMMFGQIPSAKQLADSGKIRILGIGSPKRNPQLPNVATLDELGLKGYDSDTWYGFNMPAGGDPRVKAILSEAVIAALKDNAKDLETQGYVLIASDPQEMTESIKNNTRKWGALLKKVGLYKMQ